MSAIFELSGEWLSFKDVRVGGERKLGDDEAAKFREWSRRYRDLRADENTEAIQELGREMFSWLDGRQRWLETLLENPAAEFHLEFRHAAALNDMGRAFLNAPWELLADRDGFLAKREVQLVASVIDFDG
jgi:hypothetical protein